MQLTPEQQKSLKDLLGKGFQKSLENHKVPLHIHLKVVKALSDEMTKHQADLNMHSAHLNSALVTLKNYEQEVRRLHTLPHIKGEAGVPGQSIKGANGKDGIDGVAPPLKEIIAAILPLIPQAKDGRPGKNAELDKEEFIKEVVDYLRKEKPLDISHIKNAQSFMKDGIRYKVEELMHGAGSSTGGGFTKLTATGTVDGSNTTFTFTKKPAYIISDGAWYLENTGWTWSGSTATMSVPPQTGIFGFV